MGADKEIEAITSTSKAFEAIEDEEVRQRVLRWLNARYGGKTQVPREPIEEDEPTGDRAFDDIADLVNASGASNNSDRALVAAYWVQVLEGNSTFPSRTVNNHLKHLGHNVANITMTFNALMERKPAHLMQTKKAGSTKQAQKLYKLTTAGVKRVEDMLATGGAQSEE